MAEQIPSFDVLGTSGLRRSGGYVLEEFLRQLKGPKGMELLREFTSNNPQAGAVRVLLRSLVRQVTWEPEMAKEPLTLQGAEKAMRLVETAKNDMEHTWNSFIDEALSMVEYGFAVFVPVYKIRRGPAECSPILRSKYDDGLVGWRSIKLRSQDTLDRWEFDPDTYELRGMWQRDDYVGKYTFIPVERMAHFRTETFKDNPEGRTLYRNAVIPYLRLKHIEDVEGIGVERDMTGLPVMQVPPEMLDPEAPKGLKSIRGHLERILGSVKRDHREFVMLPSELDREGKPTGYKFTLMASPGQRQLDIVKIKDSFKTDILQTFLAQFLQMGVQSNAVGSFALASSSTNLFSLALGAMLDNMEETINKDCVEPLLSFNAIAPQDFCRLKRGDIETPSLDEIGKYLQALFTAGLVKPNERLERKLYDFAGLPYEVEGRIKSSDELIEEVMSDSGGNEPEGDVTTLNGAQMQAVMNVVASITSGSLPPASAQVLLQSTGIDEQMSKRIVSDIVASKANALGAPVQPQNPQEAAGAQPAPVGPQVASATPPGDTGGVKTADQLIENVMPKK